ncbi:MAG: TRAP transporter small permease [Pseudomonadota bacterium]
MIRRVLDTLYLASGYLSALFLVAIAVTIIVQVIGRTIGISVDSTEAAGLCLAASTFFGLAHTFRHNGHVRITLILDRLQTRGRRVFEIINCSIAGVTICTLAWFIIKMTWMSYEYNDVSPGLLAIPFWIPQAGVSIGVILFALAILDELLCVIRRQKPSDSTESPLTSNHAE